MVNRGIFLDALGGFELEHCFDDVRRQKYRFVVADFSLIDLMINELFGKYRLSVHLVEVADCSMEIAH